MQFVNSFQAPKSLVNPFKSMTSKKHVKPKTDQAAIKRSKVGEMRATAKPDEEYQPLYRQLNKDNPVDRNRYR